MNKILKNLSFGFFGELITMAMSIILPRIILISFGSEVNGVAATITQIFTYISLLEAGIGTASCNCFYKNIAENDKNGISSTVSATQKYFLRIIPFYTACVTLLAVVFPLAMDTDVPAWTIRMIIIIQGLGGIMNFCFINTYVQLLIADGRSYALTNFGLMSKAISVSMQILLISIGFDIVSVQLSLLIASAVSAVVIRLYVKHEYPWLTKDPDADIKMLSQRNTFVVHQISTVIFQSTDVFVISVFCSLKEASVYTIYNMVYSTLNRISGVMFQGIDFTLGAEYHRGIEQYKKLHDLYETITVCFTTMLLSAALVVTLPFIRLYTSGVEDVNYIVPILPVLFALIQILSMGRAVSSKLITISGAAKDTIPNSMIETAINIITSLVLVNIVGMPGVLMGTVAALLYRTNDMLLYANLKILKRKPRHAYKTLLVNLGLFAVVVWITFAYPVQITTYLQFFLKGALTLIIVSVCFVGVNCAVDPDLRTCLLSAGKYIAETANRALHNGEKTE